MTNEGTIQKQSEGSATRTSRRLVTTMVLGNFGGALLTFAYFRFLDPTALEGSAPLGATEAAYFLGGFLVLFFIGWVVAERWSRPLIGAAGEQLVGKKSARLRRRALLVPAFLAALSLAGWVAAALVWGVWWPLLSGTLTVRGAIRQSFGIIFVSGTMVATFIFLATERIWRERLPLLFPDGQLSAAGGPRLRVRTRLVVLFLLMSILPLALQTVATFVHTRLLQGANAVIALGIISNLILVEITLAITGVLLAIRLAGFVAGSVAEPLRELQSAMAQVERGELDTRCPVVSNDEIGAVSEGFNRRVAGLREREVIRETFGRYVSPQVRDEILAGRASLAGAQREVTILFADIRDFTPWVESHSADQVVAALNEYFTEMDAAIRAHGGLVLQFIGDEIEAVFGAPMASSDHADAAVAAALDMQERLGAWNAGRRAAGKAALQHGIGIHTGTVLAGNIGSSERMSYAMVGDPVNVASRIQSLNKEFGTHILVSATTRAQLRSAPPLRELPAARVKGRQAEVEVYSLA